MKPQGESSKGKPRKYGAKSEGTARSPRKYGAKKSGESGSGERPFRKSGESGGGERPYRKKSTESGSGERPFRKSGESGGGERPYRKKSTESGSGERPYRKKSTESGSGERPFRKSGESGGGERPYRKKSTESGSGERPFRKYGERNEGNERPQRREQEGAGQEGGKRSKPVPAAFRKFADEFSLKKELAQKRNKRNEKKRFVKPVIDTTPGAEPVRLNRYIAQSGICSRREADFLITEGKITVNGEVVTELGRKVDPSTDHVLYEGQRLRPEQFVYVLLNKPKNTISTTRDEKGRPTVLDIVRKVTNERVYPVGRLDRNTTGLLLFTNDGEMAKKLTHPSHGIPKIYQAKLDKDMTQEHIAALRKGFELEDGFIQADRAEYVLGQEGPEVVIQIHSGRNRIVRRMLGHLGYDVITLDRLSIGPLTKKKLPRGFARLLTEQEVGYLKML